MLRLDIRYPPRLRPAEGCAADRQTPALHSGFEADRGTEVRALNCVVDRLERLDEADMPISLLNLATMTDFPNHGKYASPHVVQRQGAALLEGVDREARADVLDARHLQQPV